MKTTNLFVELVVVGTGAALFVALLFYTFFGDRLLFGQPFSSLAKPDDLASIIPVLSLIYVLGIIIDKIAYRIFKGKEDSLRKENFEKSGDDGYYKKRYSLYTSANMTQAIEAFEYGRSKVRICRGWTVNSVLLILALIFFMIFRHGFDSMIVVGIVGLGLLAYLASWSWKVATDVEHGWIEWFPIDKGSITNPAASSTLVTKGGDVNTRDQIGEERP